MLRRNAVIGVLVGVLVVGLNVTNVAAAPKPKPPMVFSFSSATYQVTEGSGDAAIEVDRSIAKGPASVTFTTSDGTASAGVDYSSVTATLDFSSRQSSATVVVPILLDHVAGEADETVTLSLSNPSRRWTLGSPSTATLTIHEMAAPSAPSDLSAALVAGDVGMNVQLTWTAPSTGSVAGYDVYDSSTAGGPYTLIDMSPGTSYLLSPAPVATTYYVVRAFNADDEVSDYSNEASAEGFVPGSGLYWTNFSQGAVRSANPDGTGVCTLVSGQVAPFAVAVDGNHLYWTQTQTTGAIMESNLDGSDVTTLVANQGAPYGVAVSSSYVYWTNYLDGTIMRADLNGSNVTTLVTGEFEPTAIAVDASHVYWSDTASNRIREANLDGSGVGTLVSSVGAYPFALAVGSGHLYWAVTGSNDVSDGAVYEADLNGSNVTALATGQAHPDGIAVNATHLYWANANTGTIVRANLDGTGAEVVVSNQSMIGGLAVAPS